MLLFQLKGHSTMEWTQSASNTSIQHFSLTQSAYDRSSAAKFLVQNAL